MVLPKYQIQMYTNALAKNGGSNTAMALPKCKYKPLPFPNRFGPARKCNNDKLFCRRARLAASGIIRHNNPLSDPIAFVSRYGAAEGRVAAVYLRGERLRGSTQAIVTNCRRTCWIGDKERHVCTLPPQNFGRTDSWKERK